MSKCTFNKAWQGECGNALPCKQHSHLVCKICGELATHDCSQTMGALICGMSLCDSPTCKAKHHLHSHITLYKPSFFFRDLFFFFEIHKEVVTDRNAWFKEFQKLRAEREKEMQRLHPKYFEDKTQEAAKFLADLDFDFYTETAESLIKKFKDKDDPFRP